MRFRQNGFLSTIMAVAIVIVAFNAASYGQISVTIAVPTPGPTPFKAPAAVTVTASVMGSNITKVVFYRNDVPQLTDTSVPYEFPQTLYQDTYTYRARVYDNAGNWADSSDGNLTVETRNVFKMGQGIPQPTGTPRPTSGPNRFTDHTSDIRAALIYLSTPRKDGTSGGTLFFPCTGGPGGDSISIYNISDTIDIPSNITLQGESAEETIGGCQILWADWDWTPDPIPLPTPDPTDPDQYCHDNEDNPSTPGNLLDKPMFRVVGGKTGVRFRDLWLYSRSSGPNCYVRPDWYRIDDENTVGVALYGSDGNIRDVIFENVSITNFTHGIRATTCTDPDDYEECEKETNETNHELTGIKMRGVRPNSNYRQLYINAKYAYDWDVQNFNITTMMPGQGAVEIANAGAPLSYEGENKGLKFLQLNCNAFRDSLNPSFCVSVKKHGGLYFKQLHFEGAKQAIIVENIAPDTNDYPIIFEGSGISGEFNDPSMKLYLIGNFLSPLDTVMAGQDDGRLKFIGDGAQSTLVDCGDIHLDRTDTRVRENPDTTPPGWYDFRMQFTHSERNRSSFFVDSNSYSFVKPHTICPSGVDGLPNINEVGGEHFDTGVLPTEESIPYSNPFDSSNCDDLGGDDGDCAPELQARLNNFINRGTIYITGSLDLRQTVTIPSGRQIVGGPNAELVLNVQNARLLQINAPIGIRASGIVIRNLKLRSTTNVGTTGLAIVGAQSGTVGGASDLHFSGLTFEGFTTGFANDPTNMNPMLDGVSLKNTTFVNNGAAAKNLSQNTSNWNIMNLTMESNSAGAIGWYQDRTGTSLQNVTCKGTSANPMGDCIKLEMAAIYLTGLKQTQYVTNALTIGDGSTMFDPPYRGFLPSTLNIRNSDFTSSVQDIDMARVNLIGKAFIVSMNNKYTHFAPIVTGYQGEKSRLTHCGDSYHNNDPYPVLDDTYADLYVGMSVPTRIECGTRPVPLEDAIRWGGGNDDQPLIGNFYDDTREDFVIYREAAQSQFLIKRSNGPDTMTVDWGVNGDVPLIGRFYPNTRSQIVIWRPSSGDFWVKDPNTSATYAWHWGVSGDVPFIGNFIDESGSVLGNKDEVAIYRPSDRTIWILNPRSGAIATFTRSADYGSNIQIGDFLGAGYDQIAQYNTGVWNIIDPRTGSTYTANLGQLGDVPVPGKYLPGACTQIGVWRPSTQEFIVADPFTNCGTRSMSMIWGSNNDSDFTTGPDCPGGICPDDKPLTINTADGALRRPTTYRPTKGVFPYSISNGQWWVHDPF